jgi:hypothetical protein
MGLAGLHAAYGLDPARVALHEDVPQQRLHPELARRAVYIHPLRWTSLGLSLIEAMHLGMPVVVLGSTEAYEAVPAGAGVVSTTSACSSPPSASCSRAGRGAPAGQAGEGGRPRALRPGALPADWDRLLEEVAR